MRFSSRYSVPSRIEISVGVAEGGIEVGGTGVSVEGISIGTSVGEDVVGIGKISAVKLQALSNTELIRSKRIDSKYL
jgi:hypothetical protein